MWYLFLICICRICEYHEKNYAAALETFTGGQKLDSKYWNFMLKTNPLFLYVLNT